MPKEPDRANIKYDLLILKWYGLSLKDILIPCGPTYLWNPMKREYGRIERKYLGYGAGS